MKCIVKGLMAAAISVVLSNAVADFAKADTFPLPAPFATPSVSNPAHVTGWSSRQAPTAPAGFQVSRFAAGLDDPRNIYVDQVGDVFVVESEPAKTVHKWTGKLRLGRKMTAPADEQGKIIVFRDANNDGLPDTHKVLLGGLNKPFGVLVLGGFLYVANEDALWRYPYTEGSMAITAPGQKILDLPAGGDHWTRTLAASPDGRRLYIGIGSATNVGENSADAEKGRADIVECNPDGSKAVVYASGLRNPSALAVDSDGQLWAAVNERDGLGDDLVPDYLTQVDKGDFFGWPYSYFGGNLDPRVKPQRPDLVAGAVVPDYMLGAHVAPLGLAIYNGPMFPQDFTGGAFVSEHGSWNSSTLRGYKVVFIPFRNGAPVGAPQDFLTGFAANKAHSVHGRPTGIAVAADGALLVADDASGIIWRVSVQDD